MSNSHHPDPWHVWKWGSEQHFMTPLQRDPEDPQDPHVSSPKLILGSKNSEFPCGRQFPIKFRTRPKGNPQAPQGGQRGLKGYPMRAQGHSKESQRVSKDDPREPTRTPKEPQGPQSQPKCTQRHPRKAKGTRYISTHSRLTAQAYIMLI